MRILIVEDQIKMATFIRNGFQANGYIAEYCELGEQAEILSSATDYDLIILDINLPGQNGFDTAKHLRQNGYHNPILMLTALATTKDKIRGLDAGADDYLTKPFEFEELLARVRALTRRKNQNQISKLIFSDIELDLIYRKVFRSKKEIALTPKEFSLLEYFLRNPNRPLTRNELSEHVWDIHFDTNTNIIDVYINLLRKKIDSPFEKKLLQTIVGYGYILRE